MLRKIVDIDSEKCIGCAKCARACHEGAIEMRNGKAYLIKEDYCDGLGDCLPACPADAIHILEKDVALYDEESVNRKKSKLAQWPIQIKLAPANAPFFQDANILIAATCTGYSYGSFHNDFMKDKVTLVGCTKLDGVDYSIKLSQILMMNDIKNIHVVRMEVPCCGGMSMAVKKAIEMSGKNIPCQVTTLSIEGKIISKGYYSPINS